jgi:hypothetical protein
MKARLWMRSGGDVPEEADTTNLQAPLVNTWAEWWDIGPIGTSFDERVEAPAHNRGWVQFYDVVDPSAYGGGTSGDVAKLPLVLGVLLPGDAP